MSRKRRRTTDDGIASGEPLETERPKFLDAFGGPTFPCPMCQEDDKPPTSLPCTHQICVECFLTCPCCPSCKHILSPIYTQNVYKMKMSDPDGFKAIVFKTCGLDDKSGKRKVGQEEHETVYRKSRVDKSTRSSSSENHIVEDEDSTEEEKDEDDEEEEDEDDDEDGSDHRQKLKSDELFEDEESDASDDDEMGVVGRYYAFRCLDLTEDSQLFGQVGLAIGRISSTRARGTMYTLDKLMIPFSSSSSSSNIAPSLVASTSTAPAAAALSTGYRYGSDDNGGDDSIAIGKETGSSGISGSGGSRSRSISTHAADEDYVLTKCTEYREACLNEVIDRNDCFIGMGPIAFYAKRVVHIHGDDVQLFAMGAMSAQQLEKCAQSI